MTCQADTDVNVAEVVVEGEEDVNLALVGIGVDDVSHEGFCSVAIGKPAFRVVASCLGFAEGVDGAEACVDFLGVDVLCAIVDLQLCLGLTDEHVDDIVEGVYRGEFSGEWHIVVFLLVGESLCKSGRAERCLISMQIYYKCVTHKGHWGEPSAR